MQDDRYEELKELIETISDNSDLQKSITELTDTIKEDLINTSEPEEEDKDEDKQDIEELTDAVEWLNANAPDDVINLLQDAIQTEEAEEDEDEDEDEDEEDKVDEDTEKSAKRKETYDPEVPDDNEPTEKKSKEEVAKEFVEEKI